MRAVDLGADAGALAADGGAELEAHHRQGAVAMPDHYLAEEDLAKTRDSEAMSNALDARAGRLHLLDAGTQNGSVRLDFSQLLAVLKGILRYFADFSLILKVFLGSSERRQAFEKVGVQLDFDRAPGDAEILKLAADQGDEAFRFVR